MLTKQIFLIYEDSSNDKYSGIIYKIGKFRNNAPNINIPNNSGNSIKEIHGSLSNLVPKISMFLA